MMITVMKTGEVSQLASDGGTEATELLTKLVQAD